MAKPNQIFTKPWAWTRAEKDAPYPPATQALVGSGRTSIDKGFPDETMMAPAAGGIPPYGQDMNGILKSITENLCYYSAGGIFEYDSSRDYVEPSIVSYNGKIYRCIKANDALAPIAPGTNSNYWLHLMDETDVEPILSSFSGMIGWFGGTKPPSNQWIIANGQAVSRTLYKGLFDYIGTTYGSGNGSTTFNVPNLIDRVAWGAQSSVGQYIEPGLPNITGNHGGHAYKRGDRYGDATGPFESTDQISGGAGEDGNVSVYLTTFDASRSNPIYGKSTTVQPPAVKLLPCIHV